MWWKSDWQYRYGAECCAVVGGDTLDLDIDLGLHVVTRKRVRLVGINTPEIYGVKKDSPEFAKGVDAIREVAHLLRPRIIPQTCWDYISDDVYAGNPSSLVVETVKDKQGKYGRFLAKIWLYHGGKELYLNDYLVERGFAVVATY